MTGRRTRLAGPLVVLAALSLQPQPASAQVQSFLDGLFGRKEAPKPEPAPVAEPEPAPVAPEAAPAGKKAAAQKPAKDKAAKDKPSKDKTAKAGKDAAVPAAADGGQPAQAVPQVAAAGAPMAIASLRDASPEAVVERANAYFNSFQTLTGSFVQVGGDGRKIGGRLYLAKPGRLRFAYDEPSPLEVVADGTSVAVRDRKLNTQDLYFISQTPLKFLIRDKIDLARDLSVTEVSNDPGGVRVSLEDRSTLGGTSKIQLYFDADMKVLSQWRITDPQGYLTTVQLANLKKGAAIEGINFFIDYGRAEDKAMREQMKAQAQ